MSQILDRLNKTFDRMTVIPPDGVYIKGDIGEKVSVDGTRKRYFKYLAETVQYYLNTRMIGKEGEDPDLEMVLGIVDQYKNDKPLKDIKSSFGNSLDEVLPPDEREKLVCIIKAAIARDFSWQKEVDKDDGWARY